MSQSNLQQVALAFCPEALWSLSRADDTEILTERKQAQGQLPGGRLAYSEAEAAALFRLDLWQPRDERRIERIATSRQTAGGNSHL